MAKHYARLEEATRFTQKFNDDGVALGVNPDGSAAKERIPLKRCEFTPDLHD